MNIKQNVRGRVRVRAGVAGGCWATQFWATQIFWEARDIWAVLKMFSCFFFVEPVKFTRDRGCQELDEHLVISKGDHRLIHMFQFFCFCCCFFFS